MRLLFDYENQQKQSTYLPKCDVERTELSLKRKQKLHLPVSETTSSRNGGSEDVSYMMRRVQEQGGQATFMRILTKESAPGHNRRFDFDEQALPNAVKVFCGTVYDILG